MGWVSDEFKEQDSEKPAKQADTSSFEVRAARKWQELVEGFRKDVEEFKRRAPGADFKDSGAQCQVSNADAGIDVLITADPAAHTVTYIYQPEDNQTPVPERGVLTLRKGQSGVEIYSADEHLTPAQVRKLILEPLLFPANPSAEAKSA